MNETWIRRIKNRRKLMNRILRDRKHGHHYKIEELEEQKHSLQRWLRFWPIRFLLDINVLKEIPYVKEDIERINAKIEKIKHSKRRLQKWEAENPNHPFRRRKLI